MRNGGGREAHERRGLLLELGLSRLLVHRLSVKVVLLLLVEHGLVRELVLVHGGRVVDLGGSGRLLGDLCLEGREGRLRTREAAEEKTKGNTRDREGRQQRGKGREQKKSQLLISDRGVCCAVVALLECALFRQALF